MTKSRRENKGELLHLFEARNSYSGRCGRANYCRYPYSVATRHSCEVWCNGADHSNYSSANSSQGSNREIAHKTLLISRGIPRDITLLAPHSQHGHKSLRIRIGTLLELE